MFLYIHSLRKFCRLLHHKEEEWHRHLIYNVLIQYNSLVMSPIMSPPPGMILDEDEIVTPNGISRTESSSDFDSMLT